MANSERQGDREGDGSGPPSADDPDARGQEYGVPQCHRHEGPNRGVWRFFRFFKGNWAILKAILWIVRFLFEWEDSAGG
ncbi:hypothetical protein [Streptomyces sp. UNOC14_S4]|uniref:hypothetical protein n=1 Tax=Streptomyces sp. UNOC14_S4 TaxID=2872340 RepID=UPI001E3E3C26|nr:hypothetical protein [Streptomyces sp. UNOC14_S4]MCC3770778.1 hypothetical protein [Streptomyces sp. UNOC14_S4]